MSSSPVRQRTSLRFCLSWAFTALTGPLLAPPLASQAVPLDAEFQLNQATGGVQSEPSLGMSDTDDLIAAWQGYDSGGDGNGDGLFLRAFPAGGPAEDQTGLNTFTTNDQIAADLDMNGSRDFAACWSSFNQASGSSSFDLRVRRSSANGTLLGAEFSPESTTSGGSLFCAIAMRENDGFVVTWRRLPEILVREYDAAGSPLTDELVVVTSNATDSPDVATLPDGGFVVVWSDNDESERGIWARRYGPLGVDPGEPFVVPSSETGHQSSARIAALGAGELYVVWSDAGVEGNNELVRVEGREIGADGEPIGDEVTLSPNDGQGHFGPEIDAGTDGAFVVGWHSQPVSSDGAEPGLAAEPEGGEPPARLFFREFQRTGRPIDVAREESAQPGVGQYQASIAVGPESFFVAWTAFGGEDDENYARAYLRRAIFADDFEGAGLAAIWSSVAD